MVLMVEEINKEEFQSLSDLSCTYFQNGVIFSDVDNSVIAFEKVDFENDNSISYWKVTERIY